LPVTPPSWPRVRGVIFDLDGTLADSNLDFEAMRREMELPPGQPLLEAIAALPEAAALECHRILKRHEQAGALAATPIEGARALLARLDRLRIRRAVFTRNSRAMALLTLERLDLPFSTIYAREDAPAEPDPTAILWASAAWRLSPAELAMVGDFTFDMAAGRAAGTRTLLFTAGEMGTVPGCELADDRGATLDEVAEILLRWADRSANRQPRSES